MGNDTVVGDPFDQGNTHGFGGVETTDDPVVENPSPKGTLRYLPTISPAFAAAASADFILSTVFSCTFCVIFLGMLPPGFFVAHIFPSFKVSLACLFRRRPEQNSPGHMEILPDSVAMPATFRPARFLPDFRITP